MNHSLCESITWEARFRASFFVFLLGRLTCSYLLAQSPPQPREQLLELAQDLLEKRQYEEALPLLHQFRQLSPGDSRGEFFLGMALAQAGRLREAAAKLLQAVECDPQRQNYRLAAASVLNKLKDYQRGIEVLTSSSLSPDPASLWLLADLYYQRDQMSEALAALDRLERLQPGQLRVKIKRGRIELILGQFESASASFQAALDQDPSSGSAQHGLGLALMRASRSEEALGAFNRAVGLEPENALFLLDLGKQQLEMGRVQEALEQLHQAETLGAPPAVLYELARAYRRAGDLTRARIYTQRFQQRNQRKQQQREERRHLNRLLEAGQNHLRQGQVQEALEKFREIVALDPLSRPAQAYLVKIYLSSRLEARAWPHLQVLQTHYPNDFETCFLLATYRYQSRQYRQAEPVALRAKSMRADYGEVRNLLGLILLALGRREEAVAEFKVALQLEPERIEFRRNYEHALSEPNQ